MHKKKSISFSKTIYVTITLRISFTKIELSIVNITFSSYFYLQVFLGKVLSFIKRKKIIIHCLSAKNSENKVYRYPKKKHKEFIENIENIKR